MTGGGHCKQETYEEEEDEGRKRDQNVSVFSDWVILDGTVSTFRKQLQKTREGGRGDLLMYTVLYQCLIVCVCVRVYVTHSNHLNYFL